MKTWLILLGSIVAETFATSMLKASDGLSQFWPTVGVILGYGVSFYGLSVVLGVLPVGVAYAVWSGLGIVLVSLIGWLLFKQMLDWPAIVGMALIIAGVLVMNLFSRSTSH